MMTFLEEVKESLNQNYTRKISPLELFLIWLKNNFDVDVSSVRSKISKI